MTTNPEYFFEMFKQCLDASPLLEAHYSVVIVFQGNLTHIAFPMDSCQASYVVTVTPAMKKGIYTNHDKTVIAKRLQHLAKKGKLKCHS